MGGPGVTPARAKCDVGTCSRDAKVLVTFVRGGTFPYCWYHSYDYRGRLRWRAVHIRSLQKID